MRVSTLNFVLPTHETRLSVYRVDSIAGVRATAYVSTTTHSSFVACDVPVVAHSRETDDGDEFVRSSQRRRRRRTFIRYDGLWTVVGRGGGGLYGMRKATPFWLLGVGLKIDQSTRVANGEIEW